MVNKAIFQIMGALVLSCAIALLCAGIIVNAGYSPRFSPVHSSLTDYVRLLMFVVPLTVVGIGLLRLRKWAALLLSILLLYPAFWCIMAAVRPVDIRPGDATWLGFLFAAVLITPSILTMKYWRSLIWRKKRIEGIAGQ